MRRPTRSTPHPAPPRALLARVRRVAVQRALIAPGDRVLVAVSGGPDSTCLLLTLAALSRSLRFDLVVAHFDHGLRAARAAAHERQLVHGLADRLGLPFVSGTGDVRGYAQRARRSLEEAARELRYRFLQRAARRARCTAVALGHTRDDQAETVLLHLLRGSGLRGLAAMAASSPWPFPTHDAPRLIRPLLEVTRAETEAACRAAGVTPVRDPTNRSRRHLRNRIRLDLLPDLRSYNPRIDEALARLAGAAADDIELLESLAAQALAAAPSRKDVVRIDRKRLLALPALQAHAVRLAVTRLLGENRGLAERHVRAVLGAAAGPTGAHLDLPRGVRVEVTRDAIVLTTARAAAPTPLPKGEVALPIPGRARFGPWLLEARLLPRPPGDLASADGRTAFLDAAAIDGALSLRRRRPGDRFQPLGMARPKKLQDFLVDAHVPRAERDALPLVCGQRGIAWVVGLRPAEWAKVTPDTRRVLRLRASPAKPSLAQSQRHK